MKLWGLFFLFWFQSHGKGIEGFSVDDEYDDKCGEDLSHHFCNDKNTFHDDPCSGVCHHQEFNTFLKSAPQLKSFKECCRKDEYTYQDNCDSRQTHLQRRCGAPNTISRPLELKCPEECQIYNAVKGDQHSAKTVSNAVEMPTECCQNVVKMLLRFSKIAVKIYQNVKMLSKSH